MVGAAVAALLVMAACGPVASAPRGMPAIRPVPHIIIDTDLSLYWDDATAVGMANVLQQRGKVEILGVMSDIRNTVAVAAIDAVDTAYGHSRIPVGAVADSDADTVRTGYSATLVSRLPHSIHSSAEVPDAVALYRRVLARQPDDSVTIVAIGAYTNLAGLLRSKAGQGSALDGRALIASKVRKLVIEDGLFPGGAPVPFTNAQYDVASARVVVSGADWPTPIAWVDGSTGINTKVGGMLCSTTVSDNPMRIVYEALFGCGPPMDGDWDGPTLLYAIGGTQGVFSQLGEGGAAVMNARGGLSWQTNPRRHHDVYVHVVDQAALNQRIDALLAAR
jgi:pyrimidine-specific ribonucleoside hydrolase